MIPVGRDVALTVAPKAYPVISYSISTPPRVLDTVSPLQIVKSADPDVKLIDGWGVIVIEPVFETWVAGSLQPKALFTVLIWYW